MTRRRSRLPWRVLLRRRGSHRKRRIRDHRAGDAAPCWRPSCQDRSCPSALDLLLVGNLRCPFGIGQVRCHAKGKVSEISYSELIRTSLEIANFRDFVVTSARTAVSSCEEFRLASALRGCGHWDPESRSRALPGGD